VEVEVDSLRGRHTPLYPDAGVAQSFDLGPRGHTAVRTKPRTKMGVGWFIVPVGEPTTDSQSAILCDQVEHTRVRYLAPKDRILHLWVVRPFPTLRGGPDLQLAPPSC
jgi:hypothetical protein